MLAGNERKPQVTTLTVKFVMKNAHKPSPYQTPHTGPTVPFGRRELQRPGGGLLGAGLAGPGQRAVELLDNFDSYSSTAQLTAAGWILSSLNPALVTTTFPAVGAGKGLRIQANPYSPYPACWGCGIEPMITPTSM